mmetsp:Transcript_29364/g.113739  ORF Transcript_29364/g.113739 Transcript_29364/m.113739 type:complete len:85 (+) Transcript_29364:406-660(+)
MPCRHGCMSSGKHGVHRRFREAGGGQIGHAEVVHGAAGIPPRFCCVPTSRTSFIFEGLLNVSVNQDPGPVRIPSGLILLSDGSY